MNNNNSQLEQKSSRKKYSPQFKDQPPMTFRQWIHLR